MPYLKMDLFIGKLNLYFQIEEQISLVHYSDDKLWQDVNYASKPGPNGL